MTPVRVLPHPLKQSESAYRQSHYCRCVGNSLVWEAVRGGIGKSLIVMSLGAAALAIFIGVIQIDVISSDGRFFPCGAIFRPTLVLPEAAPVCDGALSSQVRWMIATGAIAVVTMLAGVLLRASVPKRLQHRR